MHQKQGKVKSSVQANLPVSISRIGDQTIAALMTSDGQIYYGTSCPNNGDKYDSAIGHDLALGRAFAAFAEDLITGAEGRVKHIDDMRIHKEAAAKVRMRRERASKAGRASAASRAARKTKEVTAEADTTVKHGKKSSKVVTTSEKKNKKVMTKAQQKALVKAREILAQKRAAAKANAS